MMLQRLLYGQLPDYARPTHPFLRYWLAAHHAPWLRRLGIAVLIGVAIALIIAGGLFLSTNELGALGRIDGGFAVLYWPLVIVQLLVRIIAFNLTLGALARENSRGTWETLKTTSQGAVLFIKSRWASVFYRLLPILFVLLLVRGAFLIGALYKTTQYQAHTLDLLLSGTVPGGPLWDEQTTTIISIIVAALMFTAGLLAPFTSVAFDAALGSLLSTFMRGKSISVLTQFLFTILRVLLTVAALWLGARAIGQGSDLLAPVLPAFFNTNADAVTLATEQGARVSFPSALLATTEGDMALSMLNLERVRPMWSMIRYGVLISVGTLLWVILQAFLANLMLQWAAKRASTPAKR